ncbi:RagB/SusD family nutrient uptake outer membrane protein [Pedobacter hiemivivus]|uniref:RagB/SusD family nutrient uptake outer membrane protein n=1 Tax=Pedobacter hiemivivus TaxID=2530454 RepID=A0A4U1G138_9SPHI|nr:RagB/SusD family nutrient uptake outer membrane protein [Pedobacter hiemivivus]TKC57205.1 RagB/SusD family nutrient uptake outer membrane protein [Pedobacter hiemivivus]
MKKIFFILTTLLFFNFSCSKLLDTKPTDFVVPEFFYSNAAELQMALNGVYSQLIDADCYGNNYLYMFNTNTDESYGFSIDLITSYQYTFTDTKVNVLWNSSYIGIERANMLLANINKPQMDETKRGIIEGEALFLRAYFYFLLVSNYGDVPLKLTPTASVKDVNIARTPTKDVYAQIVKDMIRAETLLQTQTITSVGYSGKITKTAVQGMLARVYLYMAGFPLMQTDKYADALFWAQKVVDSKEHGLNPDYSQVFINYAKNKYDVKENLWELEFFRDNNGFANKGGTYAGRFCGIRCSDNSVGYSTGSLVATRKLFDLYQINPASVTTPNKESFDLRRDWNCANYNYGSAAVAKKTAVTSPWLMCAGKWRREYEEVVPKNSNFTPQNFPMLRYSDVLLMLAEAENAVNGPTKVAYDAINEVRKRAYGLMLPTPPNPTVNSALTPGLLQDKFLDAIKAERSRELCFEALRRPDLIRWGNFVQDMKTFLAYAIANGGNNLTITTASRMVTERNLLLPIPSYDLSLNKLLTPNPGY